MPHGEQSSGEDDMDTERRVAKIIGEVRAASRRRGWKPGQMWKCNAGPRCEARTGKGTRCTRAAYVNGFCGGHGGGLVMATLMKRGRRRIRKEDQRGARSAASSSASLRCQAFATGLPRLA